MRAEERKEQEKIAPKENVEDIQKEQENAKQNVEQKNDKPDTSELLSGSDGGAAGDGGAA